MNSVAGGSAVVELMHVVIDNVSYSIDMSRVKGIHGYENFTPSEDESSLGSLQKDGRDLPVYSLSGRIDPASSMPRDLSNSRFLIIDDTHRWCLVVTEVVGVIRRESDEIYPMPMYAQDQELALLKGVVRERGKWIFYLSVDRIHPDAKPITFREKNIAVNKQNNLPTQRLESSASGKLLFFSTTDFSFDERKLMFGLSITQVPQILESLPIIPIPTSPGYVLGLVDWRERPIPVIDLNLRLGFETQSDNSKKKRLLIARSTISDELVGFMVQPNVSVRNLPLPHRPSKHLVPSLAKGIYESDTETLLIPDLDEIMSAESPA